MGGKPDPFRVLGDARFKGYLNEVGRKQVAARAFLLKGVQGYLNEVGGKPELRFFTCLSRFKGYLNEVSGKLSVLF